MGPQDGGIFQNRNVWINLPEFSPKKHCIVWVGIMGDPWFRSTKQKWLFGRTKGWDK